MQMGYSQSKMRLQQRRASEDQSGMSEFEKLCQKNQDDDIYDSEADDEAEKLEGALDKEKRLQAKWKAERWKVTEARDQQTIVSRWERTEKFLKLAAQLNFSEKNDWHEQFRGVDQVQGEHTDARYIHYFVNNAGPMQRGHDPLYSHRKQSMVKHFQMGLPDAKWADWE